MNPTLEKFMRKRYVDGVFHTHVSLITPKGKFSINRDDMVDFWRIYNRRIYNNLYGKENTKIKPIGIAEKPQNDLPVLVDIDIKLKYTEEMELSSDTEKLYTMEQVKQIIQIYQTVLRKIVDNCTDEKLTCLLLEKNIYTTTKGNTTYIKNGFHLHFPFLFLSKQAQSVHLIPRVKDLMNEHATFENLGFHQSGDVLDGTYCNVPWLLYGSSKDENSEPYAVTKAFDHNLEEVGLINALKNYQIYDNYGKPININKSIRYHLPQILSIVPHHREISETKHGIISPLKEKMKKENVEKKKHTDNISVEERLNIARTLVPMLAPHRAENYNDWMEVGWILYNISDGNEEGLELWCDFSSQCIDKYDESECIYQWSKMTKRNYTLRTLKYFARTDSPSEYTLFKQETSEKHIRKSLEGSHYDIANILFAEYGDEFVCANLTGVKTWYQFVNHKWEEIEEGVTLRSKISEVIVDRYHKIAQELYGEYVGVTANDPQEKVIASRLQTVRKMIHNLKTRPFKVNIMNEAADLFYDKRFKQKLDMNKYLICFKNGVYDFSLDIFRPGRPEDFISKSLDFNYVEYDDDDEAVQKIHTFLEQVFPDKSLRKYFMDVNSEIFIGGNSRKIVQFWLGGGDNGKSVTQTFFEKMLGELAIKLPTTVLTTKKPSSGSTYADLARAGGGVRLATCEEPDNDEQINVGTFKNLSGNDTYYARDLYEKGKQTKEILPMFKLIFIANRLPKVKFSDRAFWNRVRVILFESFFCCEEDAPETYEEQLREKTFPKDPKFTEKIPELLPAFAWVLIQHYRNMRNSATVNIEPEKVRYATEMYKKQNDLYQQFVEEMIIEDENYHVALIDLYAQFKEWFREAIPNTPLPTRSDLEEYFVKLWGETEKGRKWQGYRFRTKLDDNEVVLGEEDLVNYNTQPGLENLMP